MHYRAPRPLSLNRQQAEPNKPTKIDTEIEQQQEYELSEHAEMFANRLKKNLKHRLKWAKNNDIECYRLYDADLPDYAVAIDVYGKHIHVQEYAPPKSIDSEKALQRLNDVMKLTPQVLGLPPSQIVLKLRQKQRGTQQYEAQASQKQRIKVAESGLCFWVNLTDYLDTGLFLDHRTTRQIILNKAKDKDFLNLFAYTGTATVYAAAGQAKSTTTVDMSNTYLSWAQDNMALNNFTNERHHYIRANCLEWLQEAQQKQQRYGLIFLDPPTFSNSSKMEGVFDIQRDHVSLIDLASNLLTTGGELIFSTNRRDFKLDTIALAAFSIENISHKTLPLDFKRNEKIHRCWLISKN
jgi:23S rRNA (guanine2445-N2)-methyltransferase / 23S rRNA (guanine2069-N7)-methyltransferase